MTINKKQRPRSNTSPSGEEYITIPLRVAILDKIMSYMFSQNLGVSKATIRNINKLFKKVNPSTYSDDEELSQRVYLLKFLAKNIIENNITDPQELFDSISDTLTNATVYESILTEFNPYFDESNSIIAMSDEMINYVNHWVADKLNHWEMIKHLDFLSKIYTDYKSDKYENLSDMYDETKPKLRLLLSTLNEHEQSFSDERDDFNLSEESLNIHYTDLIKEENKPDNVIKTGVKYLNRQLGGGYKAGSVYVHMAKPGGWKSGYLLSCTKWAKEFNPSMPTRDPTKRPLVLYISQENSKYITLKRFYQIVVPKDERKDPKDLKVVDLLKAFKRYGFIVDDADTPKNVPTIKFIYRKHKSIDTADLEALIEQYSSEGFEVKIIFHDYLKRIKPVNYNHTDERFNLGEVVNEFAEIAKLYRIPIVTAHQLNREAIRKIQESLSNGKKDVAKELGAHHAGDSNLIIENADCVTINLNYLDKDHTYFTSSVVKMRHDSDLDYAHIVQPFEHVLDMRMLTDEGTAVTHGRFMISGEEAREKASDVPRRSSAKRTPPKLKTAIINVSSSHLDTTTMTELEDEEEDDLLDDEKDIESKQESRTNVRNTKLTKASKLHDLMDDDMDSVLSEMIN